MKLISILVIALLLVTSANATVIAEPSPYYQQQPVSQTQQFYTVVFDNEGEAAVAAKFSIHNTEKYPAISLTLKIPGNVRLINMLQEAKSLTNQCVEYESVCTAGTERVCTQYFPDGTCKVYETVHNPCLRQEQHCMRYQQTYSYPYTYHPVEYTQNGNLFTFNLPVKTPASESTNLLLYYKANGYAQRNMGIWYADFETAQIPQDTDFVRVSLNVIPDLKLKGGETSTSYLPNFAIAESKMVAAMESAELSEFSRQMEYSQGYVKQTQALDPWESFHVEAEYSQSTLMLYKVRMLGVSLTVLIFTLLATLGIRKTKKPTSTYARSLIAGLTSSFVIYALLFTTFWLLDNLGRWIGYNYAGLMRLLIILFVGITTLALLFAPSIYRGLKNGVGAGMLTFGVTLMGLLMLGIIIIVLLSIFKMQFI